MPVPLDEAISQLRDRLLGTDLVRAIGSGRRRGEQPRWRRAELRPVDLGAGRHLQSTVYDATQAHTRNATEGPDAAALVDELLAIPFNSWHLETARATLQLRVTKRGAAQLHESAGPTRLDQTDPVRSPHDRVKQRVLPADDAFLVAVGISSAAGVVKPSRQSKHRQVEAFCRQLGTLLDDGVGSGRLREPTAAEPLRVVDLGCGNAYLTFAAYRFLTEVRALPVTMVGVDREARARQRNTALAARLDATGLAFVAAAIGTVELDRPPDIVLALHACDTATDDALARAIEWRAPVLLAAPCCHHHLQAQLRARRPPPPYGLLSRHPILRERLADTLTDGLRAALLRLHGYRVDVVEFVGSAHTPRNSLLRAVRTASAPDVAGSPGEDLADLRADYDRLVADWQVTPRLAELVQVPTR